jgi:lipoyl synthase
MDVDGEGTKMADELKSPEYVQTSLAASMALGYKPDLFRRDSRLTGLNLLLTYPEGCIGRCGFCGMSHQREITPDKRTFIRVDWPTYQLDDIIERLNRHRDQLKRVCVGMITHRLAFDDMNDVISRFAAKSDRPISALIGPTLIRPLSRMGEIKEAGADMIGVAIDAATPELFRKYRGEGVQGPHRWERYWEALDASVEAMGRYMAGVHLIVGLGETEQEMIATIQRAQDMGAHTHLFSFFPEAGTPMQDHPQPSYGQYRRVQLARYLINEEMGRFEEMAFNEAGQVVDFGVDIEEAIQFGEPFVTSGCPGPDGVVACNRPFGNERPGRPIRNYAFLPSIEDVALIRYQLADYGPGH